MQDSKITAYFYKSKYRKENYRYKNPKKMGATLNNPPNGYYDTQCLVT